MAKIVVVDDSDFMLKIAKFNLEKLGHQVVTINSGLEAVDAAKAEKPDLIFCDAEMPEMDGWETCQKLRAQPETSAIPIVLCTGYDFTGEEDKLTEKGFQGFVIKPFNQETLAAKIADVLG